MSPKPTIIFHFNSDSLIGYECGTSARDEVVARNGCSVGSPEVVTVDDGECEYYDCPEDAQVALCTFQVPSPEDDANPAGHGWAGGGESDLNPIGATATVTNTASASQLSWEFFVEYAW